LACTVPPRVILRPIYFRRKAESLVWPSICTQVRFAHSWSLKSAIAQCAITHALNVHLPWTSATRRVRICSAFSRPLCQSVKVTMAVPQNGLQQVRGNGMFRDVEREGLGSLPKPESRSHSLGDFLLSEIHVFTPKGRTCGNY